MRVGDPREVGECGEPNVAQLGRLLPNGEAAGARIEDPVGNAELDPPFVGVDPVLGDDVRAPGDMLGVGSDNSSISGRHGMEYASIGQRRRDDGQQAPRQKPPCPEEVDERSIVQKFLVDTLHRGPCRLGIEQRRLPETGLPDQVDEFIEACPILARECGLHQLHGMVDALPVPGRRGAACGADVQDNVGQPDDVVGHDEFLDAWLGRDADSNDVELESGRGAHECVRPRRDASEKIRIAALDDEAYIGFRGHLV